MYGKNLKTFDWFKLIRVLSFGVSIFLWYLSMLFSADGFGIYVSDETKWIGWGLAFSFTVLQLAWNRMRGNNWNLTIFVFGVIVYVYSILTDIVGLGSWIGFEQSPSRIITGVLVVVLSLIVELVPEPLIIWSVSGSFSEGGFLDNLFGNQSDEKEYQKPSYYQSQKNTKEQSNFFNTLRDRK